MISTALWSPSKSWLRQEDGVTRRGGSASEGGRTAWCAPLLAAPERQNRPPTVIGLTRQAAPGYKCANLRGEWPPGAVKRNIAPQRPARRTRTGRIGWPHPTQAGCRQSPALRAPGGRFRDQRHDGRCKQSWWLDGRCGRTETIVNANLSHLQLFLIANVDTWLTSVVPASVRCNSRTFFQNGATALWSAKLANRDFNNGTYFTDVACTPSPPSLRPRSIAWVNAS